MLSFGSEGHDVRDLSDLLVDANPGIGDDIGDLDRFLNIASDGTDSVVRISTAGGFTDGVYDPSAVDQEIVLAGIDLGDDSAQAIRNLLNSGECEADSMPGLEINADQVKCSHGTTSSPISDDELFYLKARGIPDRDSRRLIATGFALVAAFLNAAFGICLGCQIYPLVARFRRVPSTT